MDDIKMKFALVPESKDSTRLAVCKHCDKASDYNEMQWCEIYSGDGERLLLESEDDVFLICARCVNTYSE